MLEAIGEERSCEKCGESPAYEHQPDRFRCSKHISRAYLGHLGTAGAVALGELKISPDDPITSGSIRSANLLRLTSLFMGEMTLENPISRVALDLLMKAKFDGEGNLVGFGKSQPDLKLVEPEPEPAVGESGRPDPAELLKFVGRIMWESSGNRVRRLLGLSEQHLALLTWYQEVLAMPDDAKQFKSAARSLSNPTREDWWEEKPEELLEARDQILRRYAVTVGIPEATIEFASREALFGLMHQHENSRWDLIAAALFWAQVTDPEMRKARQKQWERGCVSSLMIRMGRDLFDEWEDEIDVGR